ncbi:MAG: heavy-metal-associated domain-containing protein [Anaerolineae bacterium]
MERVTFSTPTLYADHHVLKIRQVLLALTGVKDIIASSMYRDVTVDYDPGKITAEAIQQAIEAAGHPIGVEPDFSDLAPAHDDTSPWYAYIRRVTQTIQADLEMSGDFRKY